MTTEWWLRLGTAAVCFAFAGVTARVMVAESRRARRREAFARATFSPLPLAHADEADRLWDWRLRRATFVVIVAGVMLLVPTPLSAFMAAFAVAFTFVDGASLVDTYRRSRPPQKSSAAELADFASPVTRSFGVVVVVMTVSLLATRLVWPSTARGDDIACVGMGVLVVGRVLLGHRVVRRLLESAVTPTTDPATYEADALLAQQIKEILTLPVFGFLFLLQFEALVVPRTSEIPYAVVSGFYVVFLFVMAAEILTSGAGNWNLRFRRTRWGQPQPTT